MCRRDELPVRPESGWRQVSYFRKYETVRLARSVLQRPQACGCWLRCVNNAVWIVRNGCLMRDFPTGYRIEHGTVVIDLRLSCVRVEIRARTEAAGGV